VEAAPKKKSAKIAATGVTAEMPKPKQKAEIIKISRKAFVDRGGTVLISAKIIRFVWGVN